MKKSYNPDPKPTYAKSKGGGRRTPSHKKPAGPKAGEANATGWPGGGAN